MPITQAPPHPLRLNLIGAGRLGRSLARLWQGLSPTSPLQLQDLLTRSSASARQAAEQIGAGRPVAELAQMRPAELWLLATPDGELAAQAAALAQAQQGAPAAMAWHCSGFLPARTLAPLQALGWAVASAHPALSFAQPERAQAQFAGTVCALEGDAAALALAQRCFSAIGGQCFTLAEQDKPLYHAAAVLASNFLPVLQAAAAELWAATGMPAELVAPLSQGMVQQVSANLLSLAPAQALTGPAARGDWAVVQAETVALQQLDPALAQAYAALSALAQRLARRGQTLGAS